MKESNFHPSPILYYLISTFFHPASYLSIPSSTLVNSIPTYYSSLHSIFLLSYWPASHPLSVATYPQPPSCPLPTYLMHYPIVRGLSQSALSSPCVVGYIHTLCLAGPLPNLTPCLPATVTSITTVSLGFVSLKRSNNVVC